MHLNQCGLTFLSQRSPHSLGGLEQRQDPVSALLTSLTLSQALCGRCPGVRPGQARCPLLSFSVLLCGERGRGCLVVRASGCQSQKGPWGHLMQPLHFTDKTQRRPVKAHCHTASREQHWAENQVSGDPMQSSFWFHHGHAREVLCGYSRWVLGHHGLGTPISKRGRAGARACRAGAGRGARMLSVWASQTQT